MGGIKRKGESGGKNELIEGLLIGFFLYTLTPAPPQTTRRLATRSPTLSQKDNFTDSDFLVRFDLDNRDKINSPGKWTHVGGWRVDKDVYNSDPEGWIYGDDVGRLRDNVGERCRGDARKVRKRRWGRMRCLVGYEEVGEYTEEVSGRGTEGQ